MKAMAKKAGLVCLLGMLFILFSTSQVSAQETGTLIVYEEAQGGDASFSFSGSGSIGSFQIATEQGGGAKVFDLPAGTYTVTQNNLPSGWSTQEIFCDGTGTTSTDLTQSKVTFTVSSPADVIYLRFTNIKGSTNPTSSPSISPVPSPSIPENIGLPLVLVLIVIATSIIALFTKKKKQVTPAFALLLSALMMFAFVGPVQANPDKYIQLGTSGNDEQTQFGTSGKDVIIQLGFGGDDTQYGEGGDGDDWIVQNGGSGNDDMTTMGENGNNHIIQEGGIGNDIIYGGLGGVGADSFCYCDGGNGDDQLTVEGGLGKNHITVKGGAGDDSIQVAGGLQDDIVKIEGGTGNDQLIYYVTAGRDSVSIDGGGGEDFLTVNRNLQSFQLVDGTGVVLYSVGSGGSVITVLNVEHGEVIGDDGKVAFQW
jgi:hypothetical protein